MTASPTHIRAIRIPSRSRLLETLSSASSVTEAARVLDLHPERVTEYVRESEDDGIRAAYRACVTRGKRHTNVPKWLVYWDDPRTPGKPVKIWGVRAETEAEALSTAQRVTRRDGVTVVREVKL